MSEQIKATIIAHSKSSVNGKEIVTFELEYPRFIHSEILTHRLFSRNAASSRAIPIEKVIEQVSTSPAVPCHWGKNQSGMQAKEEVTNKINSMGHWIDAASSAAYHAGKLKHHGLHKQVVNRILEPFQMMKTVLTATEFDNFFWLRKHCYSDDTEVLTASGWKFIKDVGVGDEVVSLNPNTKRTEFATVSETVGWKSEGEAIKFTGQGVDLLVSDNHRMLVWEGDDLTFKLAKDLVGTNPRLFKSCVVDGVDKKSLDYKKGKFLGFYLGNGWKYKSKNTHNSGIIVCKGDTHGHNVIAEIYTIAKELFVGKNVSVFVKDGVYHCKVDGKSVYEQFKDYPNATDKDIPNWVFKSSSSLKKGVFDGMLLADSNILKQSGGLKYYTSSAKMADSFQRLCLEVGTSGTLATDDRVGSVSQGVDSLGSNYKIETKSIGYRVSVNLQRNAPKLKETPKFVDYDGTFVCLSLDKNHTLYVRRNGKAVWSGNCDAQPEIKLLAEKMWEALQESNPNTIDPEGWHVPYYKKGFWMQSMEDSLEDALAISSSCCAQVSYRLLDDSLEKARTIYARLVESAPVHASPFEHQASPMDYPDAVDTTELAGIEGATHIDREGNVWSGNFKSWVQYRQLIKNNACWEYKE